MTLNWPRGLQLLTLVAPLPAAQPRAAVNTAGAAAWLGQRERVQSLMQSHARWLRKLRHSIAHAE